MRGPASAAGRASTHHGISALVALAALILAFAAVLAAAVTVTGRGRDDFGGGSVDQLSRAFEQQGLTTCSGASTSEGPSEDGATSTREVQLGAQGDCSSTITVQIDAYDDAAARDTAARAVEVRQRPRVFGTVFTWRQFTIYLQADEASRDPTVRDAIVDALESVGAR